MIEQIINDEEMIALHEACWDTDNECIYILEIIEYDIQQTNQNINENIESIIKQFSLLNDADKCRVAHLISTLNIKDNGYKTAANISDHYNY